MNNQHNAHDKQQLGEDGLWAEMKEMNSGNLTDSDMEVVSKGLPSVPNGGAPMQKQGKKRRRDSPESDRRESPSSRAVHLRPFLLGSREPASSGSTGAIWNSESERSSGSSDYFEIALNDRFPYNSFGVGAHLGFDNTNHFLTNEIPTGRINFFFHDPPGRTQSEPALKLPFTCANPLTIGMEQRLNLAMSASCPALA